MWLNRLSLSSGRYNSIKSLRVRRQDLGQCHQCEKVVFSSRAIKRGVLVQSIVTVLVQGASGNVQWKVAILSETLNVLSPDFWSELEEIQGLGDMAFHRSTLHTSFTRVRKLLEFLGSTT